MVSSTTLPYAADAKEPLPPAELGILRHQYKAEQDKGYVSTQTTFNLAWGLVKSLNRNDITEGVQLLSEIHRKEPTRRRECLYYLALGHYKLGHYDDARRFNSIILDKEPENLQAKSLETLIESDVRKEGFMGMALAGSAVAVGAAVVVALFKGGRNR